MVYFCNETGSAMLRAVVTTIIPRIGETVSIELKGECYRQHFIVCDIEHRIMNTHEVIIFLKKINE